MSEIKVGAWNALNAFGDETLSEERLRGALEVVKRMDADVVAIPETARHGVHSDELEEERLEKVAELMAGQGYIGYATDYTNVPNARNAHYMSIWTRVGHVRKHGEPDIVRQYGQRKALRLWIPGMGMSVDGIHLDDRYPQERVNSAQGLLSANLHAAIHDTEALIMGDFNDMYRDDPKGRVPRALGRIVNNVEVRDYYDPSKPVQRFLGKVVRTCRMSGGEALQVFAEAGFRDADPKCQPTIGKGRVAFQLDHILGSAGIDFEDFMVHSRSATPNGQPLSDHSPITVRAIRGQAPGFLLGK